MSNDVQEINLFSDLSLINGIIPFFANDRADVGLRKFVETFAVKLYPIFDAHCYDSMDFESSAEYIENIAKNEDYHCVVVPKLNEGCQMLEKALEHLYGTNVTISLSLYKPKENEHLAPHARIAYVMRIAVPEKTQFNRDVLAIFTKEEMSLWSIRDGMPDIRDRSINEPTFLLSSKALDKMTTSSYSKEYCIEAIVKEALSQGWARVDRYGNQLLFIANLKMA